MPKIRTNRGAAKRFSKTEPGRIKRRHSHKQHILTKKSPKLETSFAPRRADRIMLMRLPFDR